MNKVILFGHCGRDAEMRYMPSGQAMTNVSVATSTRRKDKSTGESVEETQWHRVTFYDRLAEIAGEYVKKGSPIYVEGRLRYGKYTGPDGIDRSSVDVIATELQLLGGREGPTGQKVAGEEGSSKGEGYQRQASAAYAPRPAPKKPLGTTNDIDYDIPF